MKKDIENSNENNRTTESTPKEDQRCVSCGEAIKEVNCLYRCANCGFKKSCSFE